MKKFCKKHRKELFFVILYLAYIYIGSYILYSRYHYYSNSITPRVDIVPLPHPKWYFRYVRYGVLYLPGLLLILSWISLINQKKWLYGLFALMVWLDFYFIVIKFFHANWWIYNIVPIVSLILPLLYYLGKKKQWIFWVSNLFVFLTACRWELRELWILLEGGLKANANVFTMFTFLPVIAITRFLIDLEVFFKYSACSKFFYYLNIDWENILRSAFLYIEKLEIRIFSRFINEDLKYYADNWIDYYWFIRVFLLAGIFMLGILLSHQCYNNKKKSYLHKGIKN